MISVVCAVISVLDGDTFDVRCPIWPGVVVEERVRVRGLDTPEIKGECANERVLARGAKRRAAVLSEVELRNIERDKYGRILADVYFEKNGQKLNWADYMVSQGLGRPYNGGKRGPWC